jgi:hypothetical protein
LTIENSAASRRPSAADRPAQFRYPMVFLLVLALVAFVIAAPSANWSRPAALTIEGIALSVAVATARERQEIRRRNAAGVAAVMIVLIVLVTTQLESRTLRAQRAVATQASRRRFLTGSHRGRSSQDPLPRSLGIVPGGRITRVIVSIPLSRRAAVRNGGRMTTSSRFQRLWTMAPFDR